MFPRIRSPMPLSTRAAERSCRRSGAFATLRLVTRRKRSPQRRGPGPAPKVHELMDRGWNRRDADHPCVVELALVGTRATPEAAPVLAKHAAVALQYEPVVYGAVQHFGDSENGETFRILAEAAPDEPARHAFLRLAAICDDRDVVSGSAEEIAEVFRPEDLHVVTAARLAEDTGDFEGAITLLKETPRPLEDGWLRDLEHVRGLPADAPSDVWLRWLFSAATRFVLEPRALDVARHYAVVLLQAVGAGAAQIRELTLQRAVQDVVVHDACLFDEGGLAGYLECRAAPHILERAGAVTEWLAVPPSAFELVATGDGVDTVLDLSSSRQRRIKDTNVFRGLPPGSVVYGRVGPIVEQPGEAFGMQPIQIDRVTSRRLTSVTREGGTAEHRLRVLGEMAAAREGGRTGARASRRASR